MRNLQFTIYNLQKQFTAFLLLLVFTSFFCVISPALAATPIPASVACDSVTEIQTDFGCFKVGDVNDFTTKLYSIGLGFIGGVALLFIIWGGYLILSSQGDIQKLQRGKSYIVSSIIGIVLAVGGFIFYQIVAVDVLKLPGFK